MNRLLTNMPSSPKCSDDVHYARPRGEHLSKVLSAAALGRHSREVRLPVGGRIAAAAQPCAGARSTNPGEGETGVEEVFRPTEGPPERFSVLAERPRSERLRPPKPKTEAADRFRGVVRWWVGGEELAERTPVREQAPQTARVQRATPRNRSAISGLGLGDLSRSLRGRSARNENPSGR